MKSQGIRILDNIDGIVSVKLTDILGEIKNGNLINWSILFLYATGDLGEGRSLPEFESMIRESPNGLEISWLDLNLLAKKFFQVIDITLLGCVDKNLIHRYDGEQESYESCDIVIEMIDSSYWEVFSKDENLINRLSLKFNNTQLLKTDFLLS